MGKYVKTSNAGIAAIKDWLESVINKWKSMSKHLNAGISALWNMLNIKVFHKQSTWDFFSDLRHSKTMPTIISSVINNMKKRESI